MFASAQLFASPGAQNDTTWEFRSPNVYTPKLDPYKDYTDPHGPP